jgi:hypothetical protein
MRLGLSEILVILLFFLLTVVPLMRILRRVGLSPAWALAVMVPGLNLVFFWVFAFAKWPKLDAASRSAGPPSEA